MTKYKNMTSLASLAVVLMTIGFGVAVGFWTYVGYDTQHKTGFSGLATYGIGSVGSVLFLVGTLLLYRHISMNHLIVSVVTTLIAGVAGFFIGKSQFESDVERVTPSFTPTFTPSFSDAPTFSPTFSPTFVPTIVPTFPTTSKTIRQMIGDPIIPPDELAKICKDVDIANLPKSWCDCMCQLGGNGSCFKQCNGATCWQCVNSSVNIPPDAYAKCMCASGGEANGPCTDPTVCFGR